jgi:hypothetical protein
MAEEKKRQQRMRKDWCYSNHITILITTMGLDWNDGW